MSEGYKKFRSRTGNDVRIALTTGHVAIVGDDWKSLHPRFHSQAYANGCVSEDMYGDLKRVTANEQAYQNQLSDEARKDRLRYIIHKLVEENKTESFTKSGVPSSIALTRELGEQVTNTERDRVWYEMLDNNEIKLDADV